jgi:hypothetical protein
LLAGLLQTGFGLLLVVVATLRETPLFWSDEGGYPVELRHLVSAFFYPALAAYVVCLAAGAATGWQLLRAGKRGAPVYLLAVALNGLILAATLTAAFSDNVVNLLQGLPVHLRPQ